jgi:hypothetical protein
LVRGGVLEFADVAEHLEIGVHVAGVTLVDEPFVVVDGLYFLFEVEDQEDIGVNLFCFDFDDLYGFFRVYCFGCLFDGFGDHIVGVDPTHLSPN